MIELESLSIDFSDAQMGKAPLCSNIHLRVEKGQFVTIMGPSGCGKSTLLSAIVGNLSSYFALSGHIKINNRSMVDLPIEKRNVGMMFQEALLFPHMNVEENLLFGMREEVSQSNKIEKLNHWLSVAGLEGMNKANVDTISGGQSSRVSLLRTLLSEPEVILLDEPFSKLDEHLKKTFRHWVFETIKMQNIPAIQVTHNSEDALEGEVIQFEKFQ